MLSLYIGNKNYSSWSMRAAVLLDAFGLAHTEHKLEFDDFSADGVFKQSIGKISAAGKVPVFDWYQSGHMRALQLMVLVGIGALVYFLALGLMGFRPRHFKRSEV